MSRLREATIDDMHAAAVYSGCGRYRYALWRRWAEGPQLLFVMLNPSTASESANDPTIRRCIGFAQRWGYAALAVANLFAWRATSPQRLKRARGPVGGENDAWLLRLQDASARVVAAWGNHGALHGRGDTVRALLREPYVLGLTAAHAPRHPLYARADLVARRWPGAG